MKLMYAIEVFNAEKTDQYYQYLVKNLKESSCIVDYYKNIIVVENMEDANLIIDTIKDTFETEEIHSVIKLQRSTISQLFPDYGFKNEEHYYLYSELVTAFHISLGENIQREMALLQLSEDIIVIEELENTIYYIDKDKIKYVEKVCRAYDIEVSFLHLDK